MRKINEFSILVLMMSTQDRESVCNRIVSNQGTMCVCMCVCECVSFCTVPPGPPCQHWPLPNQRRCKYPASFGPITTPHTATYRSEWPLWRHPVRIAVSLLGRLWLAIWRASPRPDSPQQIQISSDAASSITSIISTENCNESHFPTVSASPRPASLSFLTAFTPRSCFLP